MVEDDVGHERPARRSIPTICRLGRVLRVQGLHSIVQLDDGSAAPLCDAAAAEDARHRPAARRRRRRPRLGAA